MTKGVNKMFGEGVLRWFCHVEKMENDRTAKRVYAWECASSGLVGRPRER